MRLLSTLKCLFLTLALPSIAPAADETPAVQMAQEAVAVLEAELVGTQRLVQKGYISTTDLQNRELELLEAQIQLAELQRDHEAVTARLQQTISIHEHRLVHAQTLHERSLISGGKVLEVTADVLKSRLRMAKQTHDREKVKTALDEMPQIERKQLNRLKRLAERGVARDRQIAERKLQLAKLLAERSEFVK